VWRGKTSPGTFGNELFNLGLFFNDALLVPETNGPGQTTIQTLMALSYPNLIKRTLIDRYTQPGVPQYGWHTTPMSKDLAIGHALQHVINRELSIHDHHTFMEMRDYVTADRGGYGPADEKHGHDDTVMAIAIAITGHHLSTPPPVNTSAQATKFIDIANDPAGHLDGANKGDPYAVA
jgi:hypothetical protein